VAANVVALRTATRENRAEAEDKQENATDFPSKRPGQSTGSKRQNRRTNQACQNEPRRTYFDFNLTIEYKFMADTANKYAENIAGKYYVDNQCIDCDLCRETAPDNFKRNEDGGYSYVYKQPASPEEEARCKEAKEACPVEAIGDNGE
jgi:ferredoxin